MQKVNEEEWIGIIIYILFLLVYCKIYMLHITNITSYRYHC